MTGRNRRTKMRVRRKALSTPKIKRKTHRGSAKRFSLTGSLKIKVNQAGKRHNMSQKSKDKLLRSKGTKLADKTLSKIVRKSLCVGVEKYKISSSCDYVLKNSASFKFAMPKLFSKVLKNRKSS